MKSYTGIVKFSYWYKNNRVHSQLLMYKNGYTKSNTMNIKENIYVDVFSYEIVREESVVIYSHATYGDRLIKGTYGTTFYIVEYDDKDKNGRVMI